MIIGTFFHVFISPNSAAAPLLIIGIAFYSIGIGGLLASTFKWIIEVSPF